MEIVTRRQEVFDASVVEDAKSKLEGQVLELGHVN